MAPEPLWKPAALAVLATCLALSACEKTEDPVATRKVLSPGPETAAVRAAGSGSDDQPFLYVQARRAEAPVPARFKAALPSSLAEFQGNWSRFPPRPLIEGGLCGGDPDMQDRFLQAVQKAAAMGTVSDELRGAFRGLLGYCATEPKCAWLFGAIGKEKNPDVRRVLYAGLSRCTQDRWSSAFERDDAPAQALLEWTFSFYGRAPGKWNPQLGRAAREVVAKGERYEVRKLGVALGRFPGPEPVRLVAELQKETKDPEHRALLAIGLGNHPAGKAKALYKTACAHPEVGKDPMCSPSAPAGAADDKPAKTGLAGQVRAYDFDLVARVKAEPKMRAAIARALVDCLQDPGTEEYTRRTCLERLAWLDRKRAATEVARVDPARWTSDRSRAMVTILIRYPEPGALEGLLNELGLLPEAEPGPSNSLTARDILEEAGRAMSFDTETGQFPNEHDGLLQELAGLAGHDMQGAVFEEFPPRNDHGPYRLRGYLHGKRWEVIAENLGDWYDMGAVLGLLNVMLRDRNSPVRYVGLPTGDQTATVLAGPMNGVQAAAKDGLIRFAGADDAMNSGKAFEDKVFEQLKAEGKDVVRNVGVGDGIVTE